MHVNPCMMGVGKKHTLAMSARDVPESLFEAKSRSQVLATFLNQPHQTRLHLPTASTAFVMAVASGESLKRADAAAFRAVIKDLYTALTKSSASCPPQLLAALASSLGTPTAQASRAALGRLPELIGARLVQRSEEMSLTQLVRGVTGLVATDAPSSRAATAEALALLEIDARHVAADDGAALMRAVGQLAREQPTGAVASAPAAVRGIRGSSTFMRDGQITRHAVRACADRVAATVPGLSNAGLVAAAQGLHLAVASTPQLGAADAGSLPKLRDAIATATVPLITCLAPMALAEILASVVVPASALLLPHSPSTRLVHACGDHLAAAPSRQARAQVAAAAEAAFTRAAIESRDTGETSVWRTEDVYSRMKLAWANPRAAGRASSLGGSSEHPAWAADKAACARFTVSALTTALTDAGPPPKTAEVAAELMQDLGSEYMFLRDGWLPTMRSHSLFGTKLALTVLIDSAHRGGKTRAQLIDLTTLASICSSAAIAKATSASAQHAIGVLRKSTTQALKIPASQSRPVVADSTSTLGAAARALVADSHDSRKALGAIIAELAHRKRMLDGRQKPAGGNLPSPQLVRAATDAVIALSCKMVRLEDSLPLSGQTDVMLVLQTAISHNDFARDSRWTRVGDGPGDEDGRASWTDVLLRGHRAANHMPLVRTGPVTSIIQASDVQLLACAEVLLADEQYWSARVVEATSEAFGDAGLTSTVRQLLQNALIGNGAVGMPAFVQSLRDRGTLDAAEVARAQVVLDVATRVGKLPLVLLLQQANGVTVKVAVVGWRRQAAASLTDDLDLEARMCMAAVGRLGLIPCAVGETAVTSVCRGEMTLESMLVQGLCV